MADISPIGPATSMAIKEISRVPANSGIAPKAPEAPTWSMRSAVCGLQLVPNRNSVTGTRWKKRIDSNSTDRTIPTVVRIAISEEPIRKASASRSMRLRARMPGEMVRQHGAQQRALFLQRPVAGYRIRHRVRLGARDDVAVDAVAHVVHEQPALAF